MADRRIRMKPGKGQSALGFAVGMVMSVIGLTMVIPMAGAFGILWTLVAVGITVMHGLNVFTDKGGFSHEIVIEDRDMGETESDGKTGEAEKEEEYEPGKAALRLEEVKDLYEKGLITAEEYEAKRKQILEEL